MTTAMDTTTTPPRHRDDSVLPVAGAQRPTPWLAVARWAGRTLLVVTVLAVVLTWATRAEWTAQGYDADGFPVSWVPNTTLLLVLVVGIAWQWVCGLAASPDACWRNGDTLVAPTVFGDRQILVSGALVLPFRLPARTGAVHGGLVIDRHLRVVALVPALRSGGRGRLDRLTGRRTGETFLRAVAEYALGFGWLLSSVVAVFGLMAFVDVLTGAMGRP